MLIGAPIARCRSHHDRQLTLRRWHGFRHEQQSLLLVAVRCALPGAIATDIAANSDSTLMNSQLTSSSALPSPDLDDMRLRDGIADHRGRQSAMASRPHANLP
jgi:hypothetical protein